MRRIVLWLASTIAATVLLFTYSTSTSSQMAGSATSTAISGTLTSASSTASPAGPANTAGPASTTVAGKVVPTRYGPVQVQLTVSAHTITGVSVLRYPDSDGTDLQINQHALPILVQETLDAQGSGIDMVSGATYTSTGYQDSLQSALDQAGL